MVLFCSSPGRVLMWLFAVNRHIKIQDVKMEDVNDRVELIRTLADENLIVMMRKGET